MSIYNYKIALVGRSGVGKSCIAMRIVRDTFTQDQEATIGAAFMTKQIKTNPGEIPNIVQLQIWDTAGQERYHSLLPMYTRGSHIILLCIDNPSLEALKHDIKTYNIDSIDVTVLIIVSKYDLIDKNDFEEIQNYCNDNQYPIYYVSSKTRAGIDELIETMKLDCMRKNPMNKNVIKSPTNNYKEEKSCCDS